MTLSGGSGNNKGQLDVVVVVLIKIMYVDVGAVYGSYFGSSTGEAEGGDGLSRIGCQY